MTATATPTTQPLSAAMHAGSQREHKEAESSAFIIELLQGRINGDGYAAYLRRLRVVYATLEQVIGDRRADPLVAAVYDPDLERRQRLDADLAYWAPGHEEGTASPAAAAYRERLLAVAANPAALVAHHYTRYLGDLSGGRAIGTLLARHFDLGGNGLSFYDFPAIPKPKPYKDAYRARLDGLGLDTDGTNAVVDEVKVAFRLNQGLFTELGRDAEHYRR